MNKGFSQFFQPLVKELRHPCLHSSSRMKLQVRPERDESGKPVTTFFSDDVKAVARTLILFCLELNGLLVVISVLS